MTIRQSFLKLIYPLWMWYTKRKKKSRILFNEKNALPAQSFYTLSVSLNNNTELKFDSLKGKKVLLVNTASDCGYTHQYKELEKLYEQNKNELEIIAFPANDFKQQEKGNDEEIAQFCKTNFGVSFPLAKKSVVKKSAHQNPVFRWLTDSAKNGWNNKPPGWNFSKYLVDENGVLKNYFDPAISPLSKEVLHAIHT